MGLLRCVPPFSAGPRVAGLIGRLEDLLGASGYLWYADDLNPNWLAYSDDPTQANWSKSAEIVLTLGAADPEGGSNAWRVSKPAVVSNKSVNGTFVNSSPGPPTEQFSFLVDLLAGSSGGPKDDSIQLGIRNQTDGAWGPVNAEIVSGPGTTPGSSATVITIENLSTTEWTKVRVYLQSAAVAGKTYKAFFYPGTGLAGEGEQVVYRPTVQVYHDGYDTGQLHQTGATAGGLVASWADRIQSLAAVQATASKQPYVRWNQGTGRLEVVFDGTDDFLKTAAFASDLAQPNLIYLVAKPDLASSAHLYDGILTSKRHGFLASSGDLRYMYAGASLLSGAFPVENSLFSNLFNGASSEAWQNSASYMSGNAGAQTLSGLVIGAAYGLVNPGKFDAAHLAIDPSGDTAKRAQIETIINQLYNDIYTQLYDDNGDPLLDDLNNVLREG